MCIIIADGMFCILYCLIFLPLFCIISTMLIFSFSVLKNYITNNVIYIEIGPNNDK